MRQSEQLSQIHHEVPKMSLKTRFFSFVSAAIAIAAFATFSFAQDSTATTPAPDAQKAEKGARHGWNKGGHRGMRGMHMMRLFHDLNLTEAQKTQIHSIMEANKPDQATMDELKTLGKAKHDGTITADQQSRLTALREQSKVKMQNVHQQMMGVLTAEQKAQLEAKKAERKQRREQFKLKREEWRKNRQAAPAATTGSPKVS
jgi:Spy/CpxP family protein refolding chaperone